MICDPTFIKIYNETFKFIDEELGRKAVEAYWLRIAPIALADLEEKVRIRGIFGAYDYWRKALREEDAVFGLDLSTDKEMNLTVNIYECPSLWILGDDAYEHYCAHCVIMYQPIFERYGYDYKIERKERGCKIRITEKKSASSETADMPEAVLT